MDKRLPLLQRGERILVSRGAGPSDLLGYAWCDRGGSYRFVTPNTEFARDVNCGPKGVRHDFPPKPTLAER